MSNQFYNYIAKLITDYTGKEGFPGDRFYIQLDSQLEVDQLVKALSKDSRVQRFSYQHEQGDPYETFAIDFDKHKLIIANTSSTVKPDFLVTLRNLVGEQVNDFKNTSLLSIVSEQLDSIEGGSSNLQKEGMPLHPNSIFNNLEQEIDESNLSTVDKVILKNNLGYLLSGEPFQQVTFFDFKSIFSTLQKGYIEEDKFYEFGLFKDNDIASFPKNEQEKRLEKNREFFDHVKRVHDYGLNKSQLEERFSEVGANNLIKEDWYNTPYSLVDKYHQDYIKENKDVKVVLDGVKVEQDLTIWEKPLNERAAGKRKRQIVIFNPHDMQEIDLTISFNFTGNVTSLENQYLTIGNQSIKHLNTEVKRKNIKVKINTLNKDSVFVRFSYKHNKKATLGAEFSIAILPIDPEYIDAYKTRYIVNIKQSALELKYDDEHIRLGTGLGRKNVELNEYHQEIEMTEIDTLVLNATPEAFNDNDELIFYLNIQNKKIPFLLTNELPDSTPILGQRIRKLIRENESSMEWLRENNRLIMGNQEFYFHSDYATFFEWEDLFVEEAMKFATFEAGQLYAHDIELNDELRESYSRLITYFQIHKSIPSLCTINEDLKQRAIEYIEQYIKQVESFENGFPAGKRGIDLFKLGTIMARERIYLTPFHPLMIAYKIKYFEALGTEELGNNILNRLSPEALLPFIYDESRVLYKPEYQNSVPEWLIYKPVNQVSVSDASHYLAKIVKDKITQFQTHFSYLFMEKSQAPFKIGVVNISNDFEVIRGILDWMKDSLEKSNSLKPVEITLYKNGDQESSLDKLAMIENVTDFKDYFNLNLKVRDLDEDDVLRIIREKISFYKSEVGESSRYAHITFYKMEEQEQIAIQPMKNMLSGIAMDGLYSSVPSMKDDENYRSGFGIKSYDITPDNILTRVAYYTNELAANLRNSGNDSYRKGEAIFSRTTNTDEKILQEVFDSSHWVTFVDPSIDLEFFNKFDENLVVIHYSDQYSSTSRYDAITVTNKSNQYFAVIKEFLEQKNIDGKDENVLNAVKAFNMFNGEWLLRIIGSKGHSAKEKLSIISAIKYVVSYLDHPNILWVPISLEEVLRVAGAVSLNKSDGVFTARNLGVKGVHSDDLLLIGLETTEDEVLLHYYPVEVKIGINANSVLDKARTQVNKTKKLLLDSLTGEMETTFEGKFYRNFFVQLLIANARMLDHNEFWTSKNYELDDGVVEKLLKDDYRISNRLVPLIGEGAILSFQKNAYHRSAVIEDGVLQLNLIEYDGFSGLIQSVENLRNWVQEETHDLIKEDMLSTTYNPESKSDNQKYSGKQDNEGVNESKKDIQGDNGNEQVVKPVMNKRGEETEKQEEVEKPKPEDKSIQEAAVTSTSTEEENKYLEETRLLLGTAENSKHNIYWEYGHKGLANRHLLISGKSGQGKTYFMQCLLLEASKQGIPNVVIDYTEGFLPNQLEPAFLGYLGGKISQKIVYNEKFPINPFMRNTRDIGGIELLETETDVAERIRSVFSAVYDRLGIQQLNAIYDATYRGLERYGDQMSLIKLRELLEEDNSSYAKTALSQIRPLIDRNPFDINNTIDWIDIIDSDGEVFIIQLTGFNREVQLVITEFILWDLWNYSIRNGDKDIPIPVIMDEAQNLDHRENSPSARILTEGRKFGWSAWYATQFLKAQLDADELARLQNSSQKIYFAPPEEEIGNIASSLSKDTQERKEWERKLASLKKGQCIVHGPVLQPNGELSTPTINIVNITSLEERI
ncbi:DNA phosphorothioation-dependent restriction protein DptH [Oceanobacillus luteolus]|uniref:DNA phosphorothioation-dependent restriction protein DptH n=1 Tax=Oceanobacillus luteolus TaxID=1274358 RepID=UPI00203D2E25|nr:DNA phosphorothioation-dependent restriction protein DptH [Oceanobacillus luteolus]MCM3741907.1 DNA phosphorothioation-dependent restriction protein DptH [Oceanobacillus luteolus]